MRVVWNRLKGEDASLRFPLLVAASLVGLVIVAWSGAAVVTAVQAHKMAPVERMGKAKNYASLPEMSFTMGGFREMDLKVKIELDDSVDPTVTDAFTTRIADRLGDRIRLIEPDRLRGAEGANLLKSTITSVVDREIRPVRVRGVLLESLVIR